MIAPSFSLYLHIPFCRVRCTYCALNTYTGMESYQADYVHALLHELQWLAQSCSEPIQVHTLYLGGGTPSLLAPDAIEQIIQACHTHFNVERDAEVSLEANPGTVDRARLSAYRAVGVTRLSLGVQSSHPHELVMFGRLHTFEEAQATYLAARQAGFDNVNLDLIYGVPRQSFSDWQSTLQAVLAWQPDHLSLYSLSLEPGTPLRQRVQAGEFPYPDSDLAADMYDFARTELARVGFEHYEISNWAQPGRQCRHNLQYWRNEPFLGVGAGAHGASRDRRYWNVRSIPEYIRRLDLADRQGSLHVDFPLSPAVYDHEVTDHDTAMTDTLMLGLRLLREGVSYTGFKRRFGQSLDEQYGEVIDELEAQGFLLVDQDTLRLTGRAYLISNRVLARFLPEPVR